MPEYLPGCVEKVQAKGAKLCDWDKVCKVVQEGTDIYCKNRKDHDGTPFDEPVPSVENGKLCYCCCSCFAQYTPIAISAGEFLAIRDIDTGDEILSGFQNGAGVTWEPRVVVLSNGLGPNLEFDFMYYVQYMHGEHNQQIIVTGDHLFLMDSGKVKPVQYLVPGDLIRRAAGGTAEVVFVVVAKYVGGVHHVAFAGFDNQTLDGHLLNANSVVTSDYAVQLAYSAGQLNPALLDQPIEEPLRVGTAEYAARHENPQMRAFLADASLWPAGLDPLPRPLVNVPPTAHAFLTRTQAEQLKAALPAYPSTSSINMATVRWLMNTMYAGYQPKITYLLDWENPLPNVYGWQSDGTTYVLVTGGLALIEGLQYEGLALMLAHGIAAATQLDCVGPADYEAVFNVMRLNWSNALFFDVYSAGFEQVSRLFSAIDDNQANPANLCAQPALQCRLDTYTAALTMLPMPSCADPLSDFSVISAKVAKGLHRLTVGFSLTLDDASAQSIENYIIVAVDPTAQKVAVEAAQVLEGSPAFVALTVSGLSFGQAYTLTVSKVISESGTALNPKRSAIEFLARAR